MSDIRGEGYGDGHDWKFSHTSVGRQSLYVCRDCGYHFWHDYPRVADIFEAMKNSKVPEKCARKTVPIKPGFYWALWLTHSKGTHEGDQLTPAPDWEVVEVWENFRGDSCEADRSEKFGVSVPGVRESQWLENFKWGAGPLERSK